MAKKTASEVNGNVNVDESYEPQLDGEMIEEQLGFPPYWSPNDEVNAKGNFGCFYATVIGFDDSDPEFERWVFQAKHKMLCHRGKVRDQVDVIIEAGGFFSISNYAQLRLDQYLGLDIELTALDKIEVEKGEMWEWRLRTTPQTHNLLAQRRQSVVNAAMSKAAEPKTATNAAE